MLSAQSIHRIAEQDSTDFDKAVSRIAAPLVVGVGFLGGRLDHELAVITGLFRQADRAVLLIGTHEVLFHAPKHITLDLEEGDVVSLVPLAHVQGRSTGLHWPIDGLTLAPEARIGTSNMANGSVTLELAEPGLVVIIPRARLDQAVAGLLSVSPQDRWPARA